MTTKSQYQSCVNVQILSAPFNVHFRACWVISREWLSWSNRLRHLWTFDLFSINFFFIFLLQLLVSKGQIYDIIRWWLVNEGSFVSLLDTQMWLSQWPLSFNCITKCAGRYWRMCCAAVIPSWYALRSCSQNSSYVYSSYGYSSYGYSYWRLSVVLVHVDMVLLFDDGFASILSPC